MIKKTSETRPLGATVVNAYDNSQINAYSCAYSNWKLAGSNTDSGDIALPSDAKEIMIISTNPSKTYTFTATMLVSELVNNYYIPSGWYLSSSNNGGIAWQYRTANGIRCAACTMNGTDIRSGTTTYLYYR